jgi:hypothetical protein
MKPLSKANIEFALSRFINNYNSGVIPEACNIFTRGAVHMSHGQKTLIGVTHIIDRLLREESTLINELKIVFIRFLKENEAAEVIVDFTHTNENGSHVSNVTLHFVATEDGPQTCLWLE